MRQLSLLFILMMISPIKGICSNDVLYTPIEEPQYVHVEDYPSDQKIELNSNDCDKNLKIACSVLGEIYLDRGQRKNAKYYLDKACKSGYYYSCTKVANLYLEDNSYEEAAAAFKTACEGEFNDYACRRFVHTKLKLGKVEQYQILKAKCENNDLNFCKFLPKFNFLYALVTFLIFGTSLLVYFVLTLAGNRHKDRSRFPNIWHAFALYAILQSVSALIYYPISAINMGWALNLNLRSLISQILGLVVILIFLRLVTKNNLREVLSLRKIPIQAIFAVFFAFVFKEIFHSEIDNILHSLNIRLPSIVPEGYWETIFTGGFLAICAVGITGPILEELVFRGAILRGFLRRFSVKKAVLINATMFSLVHFNPEQIPHAFTLGVLACLITIRYNSILPAILLHIVGNTSNFWLYDLLGNFVIQGFSSERPAPGGLVSHPLWFNLIGITCLIFFIKLIRKRNENTPQGQDDNRDLPEVA